MNLNDYSAAVSAEINMKQLQHHAENIQSIEETYRARDFEKSSLYCEQMLRDMGFSQVERYALSMDGRTAYQDCIMPQAWDIEPGSFCRIEDDDIPEEQRVIADYAQTHFCCGIWSAPTPPEGLHAELIDSRNITPETDLTGKFILATESAHSWYMQGVKRGAAGILLYDGSAAAARDFPQARRWANGIGMVGWYHTRDERRLVVYLITPEQGNYLHKRLTRGPLHLYAVMNAKIFDGHIWTVTGTIPGETEEEIDLLAHIYEPFITDDAIGAAASAEICRVIGKLAAAGKIPKLKKTLRVVFSMERYGFSEFFERKDNVRRCFYAVSLDGIGTPNSAPGEKGTINVRLTSGVAPFFTDLLYHIYIEDRDKAKILDTRGNFSDDTFMQDPMTRRICGEMQDAEYGIPVNWLRTCILPYHHNISPMYQTADWTLAEEVVRTYCVVLGLIAGCDEDSLRSTLDIMKRQAVEELQLLYAKSESMRTNGILSGTEAQAQNAYWRNLQKQNLLTMNLMIPGLLSEPEIEKQLPELPDIPRQNNVLSDTEQLLSTWIVTRFYPAPLMSMAKVPLSERKSVMGNVQFTEAMAFSDGKRDFLTALKMSQYDQTAAPLTEQQLQSAVKSLQYLEKYGYIFVERKS